MPWLIGLVFVGIIGASAFMLKAIPQEYTPREDRGSFFVFVRGPEGATYEYMTPYMDEIERRLTPYVERGIMTRLLVRTPGGFGAVRQFNTGTLVIVLAPYGQRDSGFQVINEVRAKLSDLPGVFAFPVMRQGFGSSANKPLQFVLGGTTYEELSEWRDLLN